MSERRATAYSPKEIAIFEGLFQLAADGKSFSGIKVQDIATVAGIGKGTVYEYFSSKEEILSGAILFALDHLLVWVEEILKEELTFRQMLEQFSSKMALDQKNMMCAIVMLVATMSREQRRAVQTCGEDEIVRFAARVKRAEEQLFAIGRQSGEIDPQLDDGFCEHVVLFAVFGQTAGYMLSQQEDGLCDCEKSDVWVEMICRALRP